jgi:hypothetical protein
MNYSNIITSPSKRPQLIRDEYRLNLLQHETEFDIGNKILIVDRFPMNEPLQQRSKLKTNEKFPTYVNKLQNANSGKIHAGIVLPRGNRQHGRWLQHVKRLKYGQPSFQGQLKVEIKDDEKTKTLKPFGIFMSSKPILTKASSDTKPSVEPDPRRVTFKCTNQTNEGCTTGISMHTATSGVTTSAVSVKGNQKNNSSSTDINHSLHKCPRVTSKLLDKRSMERCYWSNKDIERIKVKSQFRANTFRVEHPSTIKQLSRIFLDTCNQSSTYNKEYMQGDDEDQEEMLRDFLRDWAASNIRGLEELVTGRNLFKETRKMAVQSVLAYQQTLRETMCSTEVDRMSDLLRARSESTSHRARMFAMYLALGDALVVNADNHETSLDENDISIHME